jgi:hypothetical protein
MELSIKYIDPVDRTPSVKVACLYFVRALTSYILEVSRGKVPEIVLARICNPFAKSLCAYTSRRRCFVLLIRFCKDQGSTFLKLALVEDSIESRSQRIKICPNDSCCTLFFPW